MARPSRAVRRRLVREARQHEREEAWQNGRFSFQDGPPAVDPPCTYGAAMAGYMGHGAPRTYYGGTTYYGYPNYSDGSTMEDSYGPYEGAVRDQMQGLSAVESGAIGSEGDQEHNIAEDAQEQDQDCGRGYSEQDDADQGDDNQVEQRKGLQQQIDDDDDVGCMLHDIGEDCPFCGNSDPYTRPEKYGGKLAVRIPAKPTYASPLIEDLDGVRRSLVSNWLPSLGMPLSDKYLPKGERPPVELCNSCGVKVAQVESLETGPGHCPKCRARWMVAYRANQEQEAVEKARKVPFKPGNIVHRYAMAGRGRQ